MKKSKLTFSLRALLIGIFLFANSFFYFHHHYLKKTKFQLVAKASDEKNIKLLLKFYQSENRIIQYSALSALLEYFFVTCRSSEELSHVKPLLLSSLQSKDKAIQGITFKFLLRGLVYNLKIEHWLKNLETPFRKKLSFILMSVAKNRKNPYRSDAQTIYCSLASENQSKVLLLVIEDIIEMQEKP